MALNPQEKQAIYIEWCDSTHDAGDWKTAEECEEWARNSLWTVRQVGFIIEENDSYLVLAARVGCEGDESIEPVYGQLQKIPKTWILKRIILTPTQNGQ